MLMSKHFIFTIACALTFSACTPQRPSSVVDGPSTKQITLNGDTLTLPHGTKVTPDANGGFALPNGEYVRRDARGGLLLPNGVRCVANAAGYACP